MYGFAPSEQCWCGSGSKYKHCHMRETVHSLSHIAERMGVAGRGKPLKRCYHYDRHRCSKKIIRAHTIQRNGVLRHITSEEGTCVTLKTPKTDRWGMPVPKEVGAKQATVFWGFCADHDLAFKPIEDGDFVPSERNCLLASYRSLCFELYEKEQSARLYDALHEKLPHTQNDPYAKMMIGESNIGEATTRHYKKLVEEGLQSGSSPLKYLVIEVTGQAGFLAAGTPGPGNIGGGPRLGVFEVNPLGETNVIETPPNEAYIILSVHKTAKGYSWVFAYDPDDVVAVKFIDFVQGEENHAATSILPYVISNYCEHTFFSEKWWRELTFDQRTAIRNATSELFEEIDPNKLVRTPESRSSVISSIIG